MISGNGLSFCFTDHVLHSGRTSSFLGFGVSRTSAAALMSFNLALAVCSVSVLSQRSTALIVDNWRAGCAALLDDTFASGCAALLEEALAFAMNRSMESH